MSTMKHLGELQSRFQKFILEPGNEHRISWVDGGGRASAGYQLSVYANAYVARLKEVLTNDYPAVSMAISGDHFDLLTEGYIRKHPSHFFSLRDFGCRFPDYLSEQVDPNPDIHDLAWLTELAKFEWTLGQAFDAADCNLVTEREVASIPADAWPMLRFGFCPCVRRIDLEWNVPTIWKALTADPPLEVEPICTQTHNDAWLIWRQDLVTRFRSLEEDEQLALDSLRYGATFEDACEILASRIDLDSVSMRAAGLLKGWIRQGLITEVIPAS
ncbi:MAG: DNA-binding domain-containing protein [Candidatus Thiodiazotropha sp. (ex Codakia orbicularis)]|nr:DNA-binding domain-containing protein [Candidatus Thiodiazotropha sp. (ex Codakia orbicularis)]